MRLSDFDPNHLSNIQINQLLFNNIIDDYQIGNYIMVFGSLTALKYRVPKAVEIFNMGRAEKILFSGGTLIGDRGVSEAIMMKEKAITLGIEERFLLTEESSLNTIENVLASMLVLNRDYGLNKIDRILIVTTFYHMRRCLLTLKTYMPRWIKYSLCPAIDPITHPNNWWKSELGKKKVTAEARNLIMSARTGRIEDYEEPYL